MFLTQWYVSSSSSSICALCWGIASNYLSLSLSLSLYIYIYSFYVNCEDGKLWFLMFLTQWRVSSSSSSSSSICALCCGIATNFIFLWHLSFCTHYDTIKFKMYINYMLLYLMSLFRKCQWPFLDYPCWFPWADIF